MKDNAFSRFFLFEFLLFSSTLGLGIFSAFRMRKVLEVQNISPASISPLDFVFDFFLATLFILFILKITRSKRKKKVFFKFLFVVTSFLGGVILLASFLTDLFSLALMLILILWWLKSPSVLNQNLLMVLGIAGIGAGLGLNLKPYMVIILLIIFSIYDWISVYKTKHMIKMAREMIDSAAPLAFVIPSQPSNLGENLKQVQLGEKFLVLGGGDVAFPLMLCASLTSQGLLPPLLVAVFSSGGLFFTLYLLSRQKIRHPLPALPPIAFFAIIGYLLSLMLNFLGFFPLFFTKSFPLLLFRKFVNCGSNIVSLSISSSFF